MSFSIVRKLTLTNQTALFFILLGLPYVYLFRRDYQLELVLLAHFILSAMVLVFNHLGYVNRSRVLMSIGPTLVIFIIGIFLKENLEGATPGKLLFSVVGIPLVLFHLNEWRYPMLTLFFIFGLYYSFDLACEKIDVPDLAVSYARPWMYVLSSGVGVLYFFFAFIHLKLVNKDYEKKLKNQLNKIETKTMLLALREERLQKLTEDLQESNRFVNEKNRLLDQLNNDLKSSLKTIETKNREITESIQYASNIQNAILPSIEEIQDGFPNSFVYYEPKDIVCGDFYFFDENEDSIVVAAVDCTGHGVPGALMTVIGYSQIYEIIHEAGVSDVIDMLSELDSRVRLILQQSHDDVEVQDGMELAIVRYDKKSKQLEFAGANRPLFVFKGDDFYKYESSKDPIGGTQINKKEYSKQLIPIEDGDRIYLFTDGYCDQFGGEFGKKFKGPQFRELLKNIQGLPIQEHQIKIHEAFSNWKGDEEQVDDVLVIGIEF